MTLSDLVDALAAELGRQEAERLAAALARVAPGETVYVCRRIPPEIRPTDTPRSLRERFGLSRSTAYAWLRAYRAQRRQVVQVSTENRTPPGAECRATEHFSRE